MDKPLEQLLQHSRQQIWKGSEHFSQSYLDTGFAALNAALPGNGWPKHGLIEVFVPHWGVGELRLFMPLLQKSTRHAWVNPPHIVYAPAMAQHGIDLDQCFIIEPERTDKAVFWTAEKVLNSGSCQLTLIWPATYGDPLMLRRLQLAATEGQSLGILFRQTRHEPRGSTPAVLRCMLNPTDSGINLTLLKARGRIRQPSIPLSTAELNHTWKQAKSQAGNHNTDKQAGQQT